MKQDNPGLLARLFGSSSKPAGVPAPAPKLDHTDTDGTDTGFAPFVCSTCGRTDLPETGDWDPPICQECDAAINFDAILEAEDFGR